MSFSYGFFNAQNLDRVYTAEDFTAYLSSLICNGILDTYRQCFAPTVKSLSVTFGTGKAWINGHYLISDTLHTVDCASYVDESLDRYVVIALFCDLSTRTCGLRIQPGIAATEPVIPSFTNNNVTTYLTLAAVRLRAGATELTAEDVIDYREDESKCGYCKCILGKCRVTEMLAEMAKTNATLDELQKRLDAMNSQMSLFGYDEESDTTLRATTVPVTLHIRPSGFVEDGATPIPPTPDLYTQLLKKLSEMQAGANGKDGRSAYEIAIENGFVGTVAEWLESLKGRNGIDGKDGLPGKDGKDGLPGKDGISPDLTNYPDTDAVKALVQDAVQPLLQQTHIHKNLNVLDDLTADELSLLRALQEFEDDTTYNIQTFREAIAALNEKAHTHENQSALNQITAAKIAQWDGFGTQINGLSTKITVYSEKTERTLESLQKQIDNLTSGRNYTILFQSGQDAISTYASNLSMILDGGYQTMKDFLAAYPQFCSAENDFVLSYSQECFNWDKSVLTVCAKSLSLTKNAEIVMSYQSGSSEAGRLYLVQKPQKIDIPIGVYVNTEIDANRAVSLDFQWLQSETFITTITECTGISDGEYYLAWVGRSNNSHPKIRFLKVLEG